LLIRQTKKRIYLLILSTRDYPVTPNVKGCRSRDFKFTFVISYSVTTSLGNKRNLLPIHCPSVHTKIWGANPAIMSQACTTPAL
jgi:hypothetical protein